MHHGRMSKSTAQGLKVLRKRIEATKIPSSKLEETITIATWNVREFGRSRRLKAALHRIAEIIGQFDLVAITELSEMTYATSKSNAIPRPLLARGIFGFCHGSTWQSRAHRLEVS